MNDINTLALRLRELKDKKTELDLEMKALGAEINSCEASLVSAMTDAECTNTTIKGYSYSLTVKEHYNLLAADRDTAINLIRNYGYAAENVYSSRFESRTFESIMREIAEQNGGELPDEFEGVVSPFVQLGVSVRKVKK